MAQGTYTNSAFSGGQEDETDLSNGVETKVQVLKVRYRFGLQRLIKTSETEQLLALQPSCHLLLDQPLCQGKNLTHSRTHCFQVAAPGRRWCGLRAALPVPPKKILQNG